MFLLLVRCFENITHSKLIHNFSIWLLSVTPKYFGAGWSYVFVQRPHNVAALQKLHTIANPYLIGVAIASQQTARCRKNVYKVCLHKQIVAATGTRDRRPEAILSRQGHVVFELFLLLENKLDGIPNCVACRWSVVHRSFPRQV